jgi:hypothetical protein
MFKFFVSFALILTAAANCPANTVQWPRTSPSYCYTFVAEKATFKDAEKNCQGIGGHLTSIHESFTNSFLSIEANSTANFLSDFWIGAKSYGLPGSWNWTDGTSFDFNEWKTTPPFGSLCGAFDIGSGYWNAVDCSAKKSYVCKNDETASTGTTIKPTKACDDEWFYFEGTNSCYYWADSSDWQTAETLCKSFDSHLMSVHSQSEVNFTKTIYNGNFWIGLYSNSNPVDWNSTWLYTDGSTVDYTNWGNYQSHDDSRCVQIYQNNNQNQYFQNLNCSAANYGMCKKASNKILPSTSPSPVTSTTQASPYCINGWFYNANTSSCYTITPKVNWTQAGEYCRFNNAHLVSFHDQNELNFLSSLRFNNNVDGNVQNTWNGLYSVDNGMTWKFTDGTDFNYRPWDQGYPRRNGGNCGYYDIIFKELQNGDCGNSYSYGICKRPA